MKAIKNLLIIVLLAAFGKSQACTNFLITKGASIDGSNFISYCADSHIRYGELYFTPAADWPAGSMRVCYDRGTNAPRGSVPQPPHTYQVVGYINENQVALGETTFPLRNGKTSITDKDWKKLYNKDVEVIYKHDIIDFSNQAGHNTVTTWRELDNYLLVKYLDSNVKQEENGQFKRNGYGYPAKPKQPGYPDSWKKAVIEQTGDRFRRP